MTDKNNKILGIEENLFVSICLFILAAIDTFVAIDYFRMDNISDCIFSSIFAAIVYICGYIKICDYKDKNKKTNKE